MNKALVLMLIMVLGAIPALAQSSDHYTVGMEYIIVPGEGEGGNQYKNGFLVNLLGISSADPDENVFIKAEGLGLGFIKNKVNASSNSAIIWDWFTMRVGPCYRIKKSMLSPYMGLSCQTCYLERSGADHRKGDFMIPIRFGVALQPTKNAIMYSEYVYRAGDDIGQYHSFVFKLDILF